MITNFPEAALKVPNILVPNSDVDIETWATIACDQYTSEPEYWEQVQTCVRDAPSTFNMIFPEVYLESVDSDKAVKKINSHMNEYVGSHLMRELSPGFVLVERQLPRGVKRRGLIVALDLEQYSYDKNEKKLIRTTEGTVLNRLPPRIEVRKQALIELPHIMVLIDDPQFTVIDPLFDSISEVVYDGRLMLGGGHVRGYHVCNPKHIEQVASNLVQLRRGTPPMLYAMGDGNHSFATAKAVWEQIKQKTSSAIDVMNHPARYALVELINIHDSGLVFEPIHRVVFGINTDEVLADAEEYFSDQDFSWSFSSESVRGECDHLIEFLGDGKHGWMRIAKVDKKLVVESLQGFIDSLTAKHKSARVDYIHGSDSLEKLATRQATTGFYLPALRKDGFFQVINEVGPLPRKTFSMGEAEEKRYYVEGRRIMPLSV